MAMEPSVEFKPSHKPAPHGQNLGPVPTDELIDVSLYLKPRPQPTGMTREASARHRHTAHAPDLAQIMAFAKANGLDVLEAPLGRRLVRLRGTTAVIEQAFGTKLHAYRHGAKTFRGRTGMLRLPPDIADITEAVLGIDTRPIAEPRFIIRPAAQKGTSFLPNAVAKLYNFPTDVTGAGQCIGLIELGGGYDDADTRAAFAAMGLRPPEVVAVPVDGGANTPTPDDGADGEVALDIQVAGGAAPGAKIAVYFTVNTDAGFVDAITTATQDATNKPDIISISWGGPESTWSAQSRNAMTSALQDAANLNISVFVAAGDNLATDGLTDGKAHVDFPASSPWAIGCGGTLITVTDGKISAETVWNEGNSGTGGGISDAYPVPAFQSGITLPASANGGGPGRGVPDVAGNADPNSGYDIIVSGQTQVVGGTSAVAPLWAGLTALINQNAATPIGFIPSKLYTASGVTNDITTGTNKPAGSEIGYTAGPGWDACTGLGTPDGAALAALFVPGTS
jgi:kumamolisin